MEAKKDKINPAEKKKREESRINLTGSFKKKVLKEQKAPKQQE